MFKKVIDKWNSIGLVFRIAGGIVLAILLYLIFDLGLNKSISWLSIFGDLFVGALKAIAPILVFTLIMSSLANAKGNIGRRFSLVIVLYLLTTLLASVIAVSASFLFPITVKLTSVAGADGYTPVGSIGDVLTSLLQKTVANPVEALSQGNYIGILFWSASLGTAFKLFGSASTKSFLEDVSNAVSAVVRGIISFAPFGVLGLLYSTLSTTGFEIFTDYGRLVLMIVSCMAISALIVNPIISGIMLRSNPYPLLLRCVKESAITAFFTRSSAANIPVNMSLCKKLNLDPDFYSVSIPLALTSPPLIIMSQGVSSYVVVEIP